MKKNENVLVTGNLGFIGGHLHSYLEKLGYNVVGYDILNGQDILDYGHLEYLFREYGFSQVYHLAAQAFIGPGEKDPERDLRINAMGTLNILRCVEEYDSRMVLTSSGAVYGLTDSFPHSEDALIRPTANYGCTKRLAELYVQKHALYGVEGLVTRFSSVYGPGRDHGPVNIFIDKALNGEPLTVYGDGSQTRDLVHIDDVCRGLHLVMQHGEPGEIYNIARGVEYSVAEVAEIVSEYTGAPITFMEGHKFSRFDVERSYFDISKARELGYNPVIDLETGIRRVLRQERRRQQQEQEQEPDLEVAPRIEDGEGDGDGG